MVLDPMGSASPAGRKWLLNRLLAPRRCQRFTRFLDLIGPMVVCNFEPYRRSL